MRIKNDNLIEKSSLIYYYNTIQYVKSMLVNIAMRMVQEERFARVLLKVIQVNAFLRPHVNLKANENFHKIHLFTEKYLLLLEVLFYIVITCRFIITIKRHYVIKISIFYFKCALGGYSSARPSGTCFIA